MGKYSKQRIILRNSRNDLYKHVTNRLKRVEHDITYLYQADFANGSYLITKPGKYVVKEDISFRPNPDNDYKPREGDIYSKHKAFHLNFFAAIVIGCDNVIIEADGHTIKGDTDFIISQPFFACIETNPSPFIPKEGPGDFGELKARPEYIWIKGLNLGRSSHHGIHGNYNKYVIIEDVNCKDFDFIGFALNATGYIYYKNCSVEMNNQHMILNARWSTAIFLELWASRLLEHYPALIQYYNNLNTLIKKVKSQLKLGYKLTDEPITTIFANNAVVEGNQLLPDGNCYGFVCRPPGMAVHDFANMPDSKRCYHFYMLNCSIRNIKCNVDEVIGLNTADGLGTQVDTAGSVFKIEEVLNDDGTYKGNPIADLQLQIAALPIVVSKMSISPEVVKWSKGGKLEEVVLPKQKYICAQDSMAHLNKGLIGLRVEATNHCLIEGLTIFALENQGRLGSIKHCGHYEYGCQPQKKPGYRGCDAFGCHFSACKDLSLYQCQINGVRSYNGLASGMCFINHCQDNNIDEIEIDNISAGYKFDNGRWYGIDHDHAIVNYDCSRPNKCPMAVGINIKDSDCQVGIGELKIGNNIKGPVTEKISQGLD